MGLRSHLEQKTSPLSTAAPQAQLPSRGPAPQSQVAFEQASQVEPANAAAPDLSMQLEIAHRLGHHCSQLFNNSPAALPPPWLPTGLPGRQAPSIQRQIRIDSLNEGKPLDINSEVPEHFGFSSAGANIYKKWLIDGEDHHYLNPQALVNAVESLTKPSTKTFSNIFIDAAQAAGVDIHWLEQYLTDKGGTILTLNQETPAMIVEKIQVRNPSSTLTVEDIQNFTLKELMQEILLSNIMTQSCGNTANLIHEFLSPTTAASAPAEVDLSSVIEAIGSANVESAKALKHQYIKIEGGGHAFVVEVFNDRCKIFQSFFGRYSLAKDLERDKIYPVPEFAQKLTHALTTTDLADTPSKEVNDSRLDLFNSGAVHPDGKFRINIFAQEDHIDERIAEKFSTQADEWGPILGDHAMKHLQEEETETASPPLSIIDYSFAIVASFLSVDGVSDTDLEAGNVEVGTTTLYNGHTYKLTNKTATNYRWELVKSI